MVRLRGGDAALGVGGAHRVGARLPAQLLAGAPEAAAHVEELLQRVALERDRRRQRAAPRPDQVERGERDEAARRADEGVGIGDEAQLGEPRRLSSRMRPRAR